MADTTRTRDRWGDADRLVAEISNEPQWIVWSDAAQETDWAWATLAMEWAAAVDHAGRT